MADAKRYPHGVGGVAANGLACTNAGQQALMESNRLGIPASYIAETTHSGGAPGSKLQSGSILLIPVRWPPQFCQCRFKTRLTAYI